MLLIWNALEHDCLDGNPLCHRRVRMPYLQGVCCQGVHDAILNKSTERCFHRTRIFCEPLRCIKRNIQEMGTICIDSCNQAGICVNPPESVIAHEYVRDACLDRCFVVCAHLLIRLHCHVRDHGNRCIMLHITICRANQHTHIREQINTLTI